MTSTDNWRAISRRRRSPPSGVLRPCRRCGADFEPTESKLRKGNYLCRDCERAFNLATYKKRKALGLRVSGPSASLEFQKAYQKEYSTREHVKARRAERERQRARDPRHRHKVMARQMARRAIAAGRLTRQPCEYCGAVKTDAHHEDYSKPLEVRWLCRPCHASEHRASAKGEKP